MTSSSSSISTAAVRLATVAFALATAKAAVFEVSPDGVPMSLTDALLEAGAGDTISLGDGIYREPIVTMNAGEEGSPLVIEGSRGAVINYFSGDKSLMWSQKVVDIRHSWITLRVSKRARDSVCSCLGRSALRVSCVLRPGARVLRSPEVWCVPRVFEFF